jgi:hypothetical protein
MEEVIMNIRSLVTVLVCVIGMYCMPAAAMMVVPQPQPVKLSADRMGDTAKTFVDEVKSAAKTAGVVSAIWCVGRQYQLANTLGLKALWTHEDSWPVYLKTAVPEFCKFAWENAPIVSAMGLGYGLYCASPVVVDVCRNVSHYTGRLYGCLAPQPPVPPIAPRA